LRNLDSSQAPMFVRCRNDCHAITYRQS
jgi:hypothetical protein